jgi:hypothetical protein
VREEYQQPAVARSTAARGGLRASYHVWVDKTWPVMDPGGGIGPSHRKNWLPVFAYSVVIQLQFIAKDVLFYLCVVHNFLLNYVFHICKF